MDEYSFIHRLIFLHEKHFYMENRERNSNSKNLAAARKIGGSSTNIFYKNLFPCVKIIGRILES